MAVFNYERGCELDEILGCYNAALLYEKGEIVQQDVKKARELYNLGCILGDEESCLSHDKLKIVHLHKK